MRGLTGIEERIAEVLRDQWVPSAEVYGIREPEGFYSPEDWASHVAAVLVAELGLPSLCGEMTKIYAPIDPESGEPRWHEFYDDPHEGQKAANAEGGPLGEAWITAWTQIEPSA